MLQGGDLTSDLGDLMGGGLGVGVSMGIGNMMQSLDQPNGPGMDSASLSSPGQTSGYVEKGKKRPIKGGLTYATYRDDEYDKFDKSHKSSSLNGTQTQTGAGKGGASAGSGSGSAGGGGGLDETKTEAGKSRKKARKGHGGLMKSMISAIRGDD